MKQDEWLSFEACDHNRAINMMDYLIKLSKCEYCEMETETKETLLKTHRHLKECRECRMGYRKFKGGLATKERHIHHFSANDFRILKENESYLDGLVSR